MKRNAVFIYSKEQLGYSFSDSHPFNQKRILLTLDLLKSSVKLRIQILLRRESQQMTNFFLHMMQSLSTS